MEIESLFEETYMIFLTKIILPRNKKGVGTSHKKSDLPPNIDWESDITNTISKLKNYKK